MKNYKLIPMTDITDEARKIAVSWMECNDKDWIGQKHKLASDIMNYAENYHKNKIAKRNKDLFGEDIPNVYFKSTTTTDDNGFMQCACGLSAIDNQKYVVTTNMLKADEIPEEMCDGKTASELIAKLLNKHFNT